MIRIPMIALCGLTPSLATAQDTDVTSTHAMTIGVEYKAALQYDDKGFSKTDASASNAESTIDISTARLVISGLINPSVDYRFACDALDSAAPLHAGHMSFNTTLGGIKTSLAVGKMKVHQGGWDHLEHDFNDHVQGFYNRHFAFEPYSPMMALSVGLAGTATLQIINDVTTSDDGEWNESAHPTLALGWTGDFGMLSPIVEYGSYDNNKSNWLSLGIKLTAENIVTTFDYKGDRVSHKEYVAGKANSKENNVTALTFKLSYAVAGVGLPWIYYSNLENKQYEDAATGRKDSKINASTVRADGSVVYAIDDNAQIFALGIDFNAFSKNWVPYFTFTTASADFADSVNASAIEKKTANTVAVGCWGSI